MESHVIDLSPFPLFGQFRKHHLFGMFPFSTDFALIVAKNEWLFIHFSFSLDANKKAKNAF
jgi:hypothetical protein